MYPQLTIPFGDGYISSYRFFMLLFALTVSSGAYILGKQQKIAGRRLLFLIILVDIAALLGSRLLYLLSQGGFRALTLANIFDMHFRFFSVYGGLVLAGGLGFLACLLLKLNPWMVGDIFAPGLGIGLALAKTGCFLNGCCFGAMTSQPWGVSYPPGSQAFNYQMFSSTMTFYTSTLQLHPVQLYEALAALSGAILCWLAYKYIRNIPGMAILVLGLWFSAWRWFLFDYRASVIRGSLDFEIYPLLYASLLLLLIAVAAMRLRQENVRFTELFTKREAA